MLFYFATLILVGFMGVANAAENDFVVHEWGTFTSLEGSNGEVVEGMAHEDEALPDFVHGRGKETAKGFIVSCGRKCLEIPTKNLSDFSVTQKMETPVIYFYSQEAREVTVKVDFPQGIISQYYPAPLSFAPPLNKVASLSHGSMTWKVQVSKDVLPLIPVDKDNIWAPSRQVAANYISAQGENEKLIFYRGLGSFHTPLKVTSNEADVLTLENQSTENIMGIFLLRVTEAGGQIIPLEDLNGNSSLNQKLEFTFSPLNDYVQTASLLVAKALEASGLYPDEALAMVNTWKKSYFATPGTRILYVLPRAWTENLLPMNLQPSPRELVRTLVGRIEVFTAKEEGEALSLLLEFDNNNDSFSFNQLGRFAEPKLRRLLQRAEELGNTALENTLASLIDEAANQQ